MKVLDLCSGLGGFSEAFQVNAHDVLRIENNPLLKNVPDTKLMCIFEFRDWIEDRLVSGEIINVDIILFSPPML